MDLQQLSDLYEIQRLKARYFRCVDTKEWEELRDVFTEDAPLFIDESPDSSSNIPAFANADALISYLSSAKPGKVTVHQGHMPEIAFIDADTATGIWAMNDWVDDPGRGVAWQGYGHYHERYVRCRDGRWRIAHLRLTRLRVDPLEPRSPGPAPRPWDDPAAPE